MMKKSIQELKEKFYILLEKNIQMQRSQTQKEESYPSSATILNLFLNETERYIGGKFDHSRILTNNEIEVLTYAHTLLFSLMNGKTTPRKIYEELKTFSENTKGFYDAVYEINSSEYDRLLEKDKNINTALYESTPLIHAVKNTNLKMVIDIIKQGGNVNQPDKKGLTPLYYALKEKRVPSGATHSLIVQFLLQSGARTTNLDGKGASAISLAVKNNRPRCLLMLLSGKKLSEGFIKNEDGKKVSYLNYAVQNSFFNVFQILLAHGLKSQSVDETGLTPMQTAEKLKKWEYLEVINNFCSPDFVGKRKNQSAHGSQVLQTGYLNPVVTEPISVSKQTVPHLLKSKSALHLRD